MAKNKQNLTVKKLKSELLNRGLPSNEKKRIYQEGLSEKKLKTKRLYTKNVWITTIETIK